jgi:anti-sigma B factor antagonist
LPDAIAHIAPPLLDLETRVHGTTRTVAAAGELDFAVCERFQTAVDAAVAAGPQTVVVDLSSLTFIDSSGLHALVRAHGHAKARDVALVIIPAPAALHAAFRASGLGTALPFVLEGPS